jgi:enamine deaminase RidA (YjgF/YER057c/UK114 family)
MSQEHKIMKTKVEYINPEGTCPAQGLYSHVTRVPAGPLLFIAGQLSVARNGDIVGKGDFDRQFQQIFQNIRDVLEGMGVGFEHVVRFTTYFVHSQDIEKFMKARADLFPKIFAGPLYPPNTILVIDRLVKEEFLLEIDVVARAAD